MAAEIQGNQAAYGEMAGISATDFNRFNEMTTQIQQIKKFLGPTLKLAEVLEETLTETEDRRETLIRKLARSVDVNASDAEGVDLNALYEKTRSYRSAAANKAAKTRKKNEAAQAAGDPATGTSGG